MNGTSRDSSTRKWPWDCLIKHGGVFTLGETNIYLWTKEEEGLWNPISYLAQPCWTGRDQVGGRREESQSKGGFGNRGKTGGQARLVSHPSSATTQCRDPDASEPPSSQEAWLQEHCNCSGWVEVSARPCVPEVGKVFGYY